MTTTHPPKPTTKPTADSEQPTAPLAVVFTPETGEACLQSCRGGSISWAFGPITNPTTLRISPGLNGPISRELWEKAKERPDTQLLMGRGLLQEIELPADGTLAASSEINIHAVPIPVAIRLVYGCRNVERLEGWLRKEDRQQLRERLAGRIKELNDGQL